MTVKELSERMDSDELTEWLVMHRYYQAIPDLNRSMALLTTAVIAQYAGRGNVPHPSRFMGLDTPPRHEIQDQEALEQLKADMDRKWQHPSD